MANSLVRVSPVLFIKEIADQLIRKNFQNLSDYFAAENQLLGFQFAELIFTAAVTNQAMPHSLGLVPLDVIVTRVTGPGTVTFNYGAFTDKNLYLSTSDACRVRFLYGTYWNETPQANNQPTDEQTFG